MDPVQIQTKFGTVSLTFTSATHAYVDAMRPAIVVHGKARPCSVHLEKVGGQWGLMRDKQGYTHGALYYSDFDQNKLPPTIRQKIVDEIVGLVSDFARTRPEVVNGAETERLKHEKERALRSLAEHEAAIDELRKELSKVEWALMMVGQE